jgi:hypothetical protein
MMKYKIGFTIDGETLFGMLARFLPVNDLSVEELAPAPMPRMPAAKVLPIKHHPKSHKHKRVSKGPALNAGINRVIMDALSDGKAHKAVDLKPLLKAATFSENSVGSRLQALREHGIVEQVGDGSSWRLCEQRKQA